MERRFAGSCVLNRQEEVWSQACRCIGSRQLGEGTRPHLTHYVWGTRGGNLSAATVISESPELQKEQGPLCSSRASGPEAGPDSRS